LNGIKVAKLYDTHKLPFLPPNEQKTCFSSKSS